MHTLSILYSNGFSTSTCWTRACLHFSVTQGDVITYCLSKTSLWVRNLKKKTVLCVQRDPRFGDSGSQCTGGFEIVPSTVAARSKA
jgi:hypothetical protein